MTHPTRIDGLREQLPVILPSLLQCDFGNLEREVGELEAAGVRGLHLDVMDGNFVPNLTYGMPIVAALRRLTELPLDVHLMIAQPERYAEQFVDAGADMITFHIEACAQPVELLQRLRSLDVAAGIALNPKTPLRDVEPCLALCDLVLVMSVPAGFGGQRFDPSALDKLRSLRGRDDHNALLQVDGGINASTIEDCAAAGADAFVVGSALFSRDISKHNAEFYTQVVQSMRRLACDTSCERTS